jgi:hypothetical protein
MIIKSEPRSHSKRRKWTAHEDNLIRQLNSDYGDMQILVERLGVGERQIRERRRTLRSRDAGTKPKSKIIHLTPTVSRPSFFEEEDFEKRLRAGR